MRILITGTSGRIGSVIASTLKRKETVICLDNRAGMCTNSLIDLRERERVFECVRRVDAVIHCAAFLPQHIGVHSDRHFWEVNVGDTENLLDACLRYGVKRFVFTSTTSIYR